MPLIAPFIPPRYGGGIGATITQLKSTLSGSQQGAATMLNTLAKIAAALSGTQKQSGTMGATMVEPVTAVSDTRPPVILSPSAALSGSQQQSGVMGATVTKAVTALTGTQQPKGAINVTAQKATYSSTGVTGGFVTRDAATGNLILNSQRFRFSGANASTLGFTAAPSAYGATVDAQGMHLSSHSEIDAALTEAVAMNAKVIRAWAAVLSIGKTNAVQPTLGVFNTAALEPVDYLLQQCSSLNIKLILPLVDNYQFEVGGKFNYCTLNGVTPDGDATQFFSNTTIINSFKAHISFVLNHVNVYTGIAYKNDPTIMCWETGNELTASGLAAATFTSWISNIAAHIKTTLIAQQLVMDGSYGLGDPPGVDRLTLTQIDIYSDHTYDNFRYPTYLANEGAQAHAWGKAFVVGEYTWNGKDASSTQLAWELPELLSQIRSAPGIDGDAYWALLPPLTTGDVFAVHSPGDNANMTTRGNQLTDHAAEMTSRAAIGPRVVATVAASSTAVATRGAQFSSSIYRPEMNDLIVLFGGNNATPLNGSVATAPAGWINPLGANVGVASDSHTLAVFYHFVTAAEQEAGTTLYTATMWTATSWGESHGIAVRGADPNNPIDAINTAFSSLDTATPHVLASLPGASLSSNSLVLSCVCANSLETYTLPSTRWGTLGTSNGQQGAWSGVLNKLTDAGVAIAATNITPSAGDEYASITIAFNPAPVVNETAIAPARNQTVAMGDSITAYGGAFYYQPWLGPIYLNQMQLLTRQRIRYGGVYATGGLHMTQIRDTWLSQVLALSPPPGANILFLGTNDAGNMLTYNQATFKSVLDPLLAAGIAPILVTLMPRDDAPTENPDVLTWNAWIHQFAAANGYFVIEAYSEVSDPDGTYKTGYTSDGLHPTEIAYRAIADRAIADGLPALFPATPTGLTSKDSGTLSNYFNDGTNNLGLFTTDTDADGVANGFTKSATGLFSLVTPLAGDNLVGNWQQIRHSTTGQTIYIQRTMTGWTAGQKTRFSCRVQTENISTTATPWFIELRMTVPPGFTYPNGTSSTDIRLGVQNWKADSEGLFYVDFTIPTGTTTIVFTGALEVITAGEDPKLRLGELTMYRADLPTGTIGATITKPTASLSGAVPVIGNISAATQPAKASLTGTWSVPIIDGGSPSAAGPDIVNAGSPSAAGPDIIDASTV